MVSKCANPGCSAPFLYMRQGKLFCIETGGNTADKGPTFGADPTVERKSRHLEFFWLCDGCAPQLTLSFRPGVGVIVQPLEQAVLAAQ